METSRIARTVTRRWTTAGAMIAIAGAAALVPSYQARRAADPQEKNSSAPAADQSTSLNDQTDLAVTVYNSNIALIRDVRQLQLPTGAFRLKFMDIAATVNPPQSISALSPSRKSWTCWSRITNTTCSNPTSC